LTRSVAWVWRVLVGLGCSALLGWIALAIYFDFALLGPPWLRAGLAILVSVGAVVALWLVRPRRWVVAGILGAFVVVLAAWLAIPPSNDRDWQPDVATLAYAGIQGDRVTVHNVRNAEYRTETDYAVRLEDRALDLAQLRFPPRSGPHSTPPTTPGGARPSTARRGSSSRTYVWA
jgi:hypothetical protein